MSDQAMSLRQDASAADDAPIPIVLGGGINGLSAVRSLAHAGLRPVVVVEKKYDVASVSRYARRFLVSSFRGDDFIEELLQLRKVMPHGGALIFADDRPLLTVSRGRDRVAPWFRFQLPLHELLVDLTLKERFFRLAQLGGYPAPRTLLVQNHSDLNGLRDLRPPLCIKPNSRSPAYDAHFTKAYRIETEADARLLCARILDTVGEVVVQEWIEGSNDSIYFCLCYMGPGVPVAFTGRKGRSWPPQVGLTASCWAAPEVAEELEDLTIRFFRSIGLTNGFASMEYKRDQRDGAFWFIEPTVGRIDGQVEISALCGVNLCYVGYCDAAGLPRPPLNLDPTHVWRDEFRDFVAARLLGVSCSYPPSHRIHNAYWRWNDPGPALLASANGAKETLRSVLQRHSRAAAKNVSSESFAGTGGGAGADATTADRTNLPRSLSFSVVICAHSMERWFDICEAVGSVLAQTTPANEIVLVIDHNRELFERCQKEFHHVKVIENCEAKGLSGARNSGVAGTKGDIIAFLDDDAVADPGWLEAMAPLFQNPFLSGVGAAASPRWLAVKPRWFPDEFLWVVGCGYRGLEAGAVRNGLGCAMGLRRSIFQEIGGFEPRLGRNGSRLPISCEETEFSLRAARAIPNASFVHAPAAAVEHKVPAERLTFRYFVVRCFAEGVSKARVKRLAGASSLATERTYVLRTLSRGTANGIAEAMLRFDGWAGARALAIIAGLASTVAGYAWESLRFTHMLGERRGNRRAGHMQVERFADRRKT